MSSLQLGLDALRRGDAAAARASFEALAAQGQAGSDGFLGLAYACVALRDTDAARQAVDAALEAEPGHLRALILKADLLHAAGDLPGAAAFYRAAPRAVPPGARLPPDLQREVERAAAMCERLAGSLATALRDELGTGGSARFRQSLDLLLGDKALYLPQPQLYLFPELPAVQFHDREAFPWLDGLEAQTEAIRDEVLALLPDGAAFEPYLQPDPSRPRGPSAPLMGNLDWSAFYLWRNGQVVSDHAARCPRTMAALEAVPLVRIPGRLPSVLFSQLRPGAHIPPHHGFLNTRLIVHLPLVVPPGCRFRVGNETREWVQGQAWVFDDTIEHEAWNTSDRTRVVLLFEVWRPELTAEEREQVARLFAALDGLQGGRSDWRF